MGPLTGIRVVEFQAIGPAPFCGMLLADMGADVLIVHRAEGADLGIGMDRKYSVITRGRRSVMIDLKSADGVSAALEIVARADVLIEGLRPGVMERLGLGPEACLERNPRLVYGRMTGWGQTGPLKHRAGHDINYIAMSGALNAIGPAGAKPVPPLNLIGDFGGGGMMLAFGIAAALVESRSSGSGQVVDAAMLDGAALLSSTYYGMVQAGVWGLQRGSNPFDSGAPYYDTYQTQDGRYVSIGALEPQFYAELLARLGLDPAQLPPQRDRSGWPLLRERFASLFLNKTRDEWCRVFAGSDACFAPVLDFQEATTHPDAQARDAFISIDGVRQPAPAPRFSRTPGAVRRGPPTRGQHGDAALRDWGFDDPQLAGLSAKGVRWNS